MEATCVHAGCKVMLVSPRTKAEYLPVPRVCQADHASRSPPNVSQPAVRIPVPRGAFYTSQTEFVGTNFLPKKAEERGVRTVRKEGADRATGANHCISVLLRWPLCRDRRGRRRLGIFGGYEIFGELGAAYVYSLIGAKRLEIKVRIVQVMINA